VDDDVGDEGVLGAQVLLELGGELVRVRQRDVRVDQMGVE
jgi:hypothetical protein